LEKDWSVSGQGLYLCSSGDTGPDTGPNNHHDDHNDDHDDDNGGANSESDT
jgi:hypothetical protein